MSGSNETGKHVPSVDASFRNPGYHPTCSCGWRGQKAWSEDIAVERARDHASVSS